MSVSRRYTVADLEAMPYNELERYEVIDGELFVTHAPSLEHQNVIDELQAALRTWSRASGRGMSYTVPGLVFASGNAAIPDLIWVSWERQRIGKDSAGHLTLAPELVVEVLSPGAQNVRRDREVKLGLYSREGVDEYWIVDWQGRSIQVYRQGEGGLALIETLTGAASIESPLFPGLRVPIDSLWPPAL